MFFAADAVPSGLKDARIGARPRLPACQSHLHQPHRAGVAQPEGKGAHLQKGILEHLLRSVRCVPSNRLVPVRYGGSEVGIIQRMAGCLCRWHFPSSVAWAWFHVQAGVKGLSRPTADAHGRNMERLPEAHLLPSLFGSFELVERWSGPCHPQVELFSGI